MDQSQRHREAGKAECQTRIYGCGWNCFNQISAGENANQDIVAIPTLIQDEAVVANKVVAASWSSTIFRFQRIEERDESFEEGNSSISVGPEEFLSLRGFPVSSSSKDHTLHSHGFLGMEDINFKENLPKLKFFGKDSLVGCVDHNGLIRTFKEGINVESFKDPSEPNLQRPALVAWKDAVMDGQGRILALTKSDKIELYLFVSLAQFISQSQAGLDESLRIQSSEVEILSLKAASSHFLIHTNPSSTNKNQIYSIGDSRYGQLGVRNPTSKLTAQAIPAFDLSEGFPSRIKKVETGGRHCVALSEDGSAYVWGWNGDGQLGLSLEAEEDGDSSKEPPSVCYEPTMISLGDGELDIVDVGCGNDHTVLVTQDGKVWVAGSNKYGQLGLDSSRYAHKQISFIPNDFFGPQMKAKKVKCSHWGTFVQVYSS